MTSTSSIIVGLDGAPASLAALRWAFNKAVESGASVEVIHCWHSQSMRDVAFSSAHELHNASLCMLDNEIAAALRDTVGSPTVVASSVNGNPAAVLLERAKQASLLVLGAHSRNTLQDMIFGQVAATCRKRADCPVVIVDATGGTARHQSARASVAAG